MVLSIDLSPHSRWEMAVLKIVPFCQLHRVGVNVDVATRAAVELRAREGQGARGVRGPARARCLGWERGRNEKPLASGLRSDGVQIHWRTSVSHLETLTSKHEFTTLRTLDPNRAPPG